MFFKKKKISPKRNKIPFILWSLWGIAVFFMWIFLVSAFDKLTFEVFNFDPSTHATISANGKTIKENEDKETTYILLVWRWGGNHDAPNLTDTMILAGINPVSQSITLFSIPRDLWVEYPDSRQRWKINAIYESSMYLWEEEAMWKLKNKISEITGKQVDYYMNADFKWFIEVVNALGWVEVTLEENFVDYEYPDGNLGYKTFILRKWTWTLDWEVALMYARSRHSTSDFDRSLRQQQILSSVREKVSNLWYLRDSKKILQLYNIFSEFVETDIGLTDMVKIWLEIKSWDDTQMLSFNLNDSCYSWSPNCMPGWLLYVPLREYFNGASVLLPKNALAASPSNYEDIKRFAGYIYDSPEVFYNPQKIVIYNASGIPLLAWKLAEKLKPFGIQIDEELGTQTLKEKNYENSILLYNNLQSDNETLKILSDFLDIPQEESDIPQHSWTGTTIEIILTNQNDI